MKIHDLKLSQQYYDDSEKGIKNFEIRKNDRNFNIGDIVRLNEWSCIYYSTENLEKYNYNGSYKSFEGYTGRTHYKMITYILEDPEYLKDGYVCLGLTPVSYEFMEALNV